MKIYTRYGVKQFKTTLSKPQEEQTNIISTGGAIKIDPVKTLDNNNDMSAIKNIINDKPIFKKTTQRKNIKLIF